MIDAVLSLHTNPYACGVAKFSMRLARQLGVPFYGLDAFESCQHPLVSLKWSEAKDAKRPALGFDPTRPYDLFAHDVVEDTWLSCAQTVYAANAVIARALRVHWPNKIIEAWCPSMIETPRPRADLTVLTFGMAHKQSAVRGHFEKLKRLLDDYGTPYTILVSTGVHEGSPWDETLEASADTMRAIFGNDHVEVLGYLSDSALHREIMAASVCVAFFDPAFRANNTTGWAILERKRPFITNCDIDSPYYTSLDIQELTEWPAEKIRVCDGRFALDTHTWARLVERLQCESSCAK